MTQFHQSSPPIMKTRIYHYIASILFAVILSSATAFAQTAATVTEHTVQRGESLESIASKYNVTPQAILDANPTIKTIFTGIKLTIPAPTAQPLQQTATQQTDLQQHTPQTTATTNDDTTSHATHPFFCSASYECLDWDAFKNSGYYSLAIEATSVAQWDNFHVGSFLSFGANYGLTPIDDNEGLLVKFGPSARLDLTDNIYINLPVLVNVLSTSPEGSTKYEWGMSIIPTLHLFMTEKVGIFAGVQSIFSFKSNSDTNFGVRFGLSYAF